MGGWVSGYAWNLELSREHSVHSATNEVPKCRFQLRALLRHHYDFLTEVTRPIVRMRSRYLVIPPILLGRFGSNLLFGTSWHVSNTQPPSDSCHACTY